MKTRTLRILALAIGLTGVKPLSVFGADKLYHVTPLGGLPGAWFPLAGPSAINERTQLAGRACCFKNSHELQAFLWDPIKGILGLGDLPGGTREVSEGEALNNAGHVAGASQSVNGVEAFFWSPETGMIGLGDLPGGITHSWAYGINDLDQLVGSSVGVNGGEAFLWDAQNGMIGLGDLPGANFSSGALDINNAGQVCGGGVSERGFEAFIWDEVNGMRTLGTFPDGVPTNAHAINDLGQVTGIGATPRGTMAFFWDPKAGIQWLGHLPGRFPATVGRALNERGQVVGQAWLDGPSTRAFIWDARHGIRSLTDLLDVSASLVSGPPLTLATGINNRGEITTGDGVFGYLLRPFVLADMNCDDALNAGDVDPFFLALVDYARYEVQYPNCHGDWAGDINQDARFDAADIDAFFELLGG